jgi:hypothetical protein
MINLETHKLLVIASSRRVCYWLVEDRGTKELLGVVKFMETGSRMKAAIPKDVDAKQAESIFDQSICMDASDRGETPAIEHFYPPLDCDEAELLDWLSSTGVVKIIQNNAEGELRSGMTKTGAAIRRCGKKAAAKVHSEKRKRWVPVCAKHAVEFRRTFPD